MAQQTLIVNIQVVIASALTLVTQVVNLVVGQPFTKQLEVTGGVPPYQWTNISGLPAGTSISPSGLFAGTPTVVGTATITATISDSGVA